MANLNLDHLTTFRLVVSRGSFSGATEALGAVAAGSEPADKTTRAGASGPAY